MLLRIIAIIIIISISSTAMAFELFTNNDQEYWKEETKPADKYDWDFEDKLYQVLFAGVHITDWMQTRQGLKQGYAEGNPMMGEQPSSDTVDLYFGATLIGHTIIAHLLPKKARNFWQVFWIGTVSGMVWHNVVAGIKLSF